MKQGRGRAQIKNNFPMQPTNMIKKDKYKRKKKKAKNIFRLEIQNKKNNLQHGRAVQISLSVLVFTKHRDCLCRCFANRHCSVRSHGATRRKSSSRHTSITDTELLGRPRRICIKNNSLSNGSM
ncbi:unnamed protein product [Amoebophrya sp. A120]|nr:unnamed protein product [Amoebophrya sp. A120]|eukprot:GSA120T00020976001.1